MAVRFKDTSKALLTSRRLSSALSQELIVWRSVDDERRGKIRFAGITVKIRHCALNVSKMCWRDFSVRVLTFCPQIVVFFLPELDCFRQNFDFFCRILTFHVKNLTFSWNFDLFCQNFDLFCQNFNIFGCNFDFFLSKFWYQIRGSIALGLWRGADHWQQTKKWRKSPQAFFKIKHRSQLKKRCLRKLHMEPESVKHYFHFLILRLKTELWEKQETRRYPPRSSSSVWLMSTSDDNLMQILKNWAGKRRQPKVVEWKCKAAWNENTRVKYIEQQHLSKCT